MLSDFFIIYKRYLFIALVVFISGSSEEISWISDYEKAMEQAREEKKPMMLFFSGSDWCPWCKKMDKKILKDPAFIDEMREIFVFALVDFPKKKKLPDKIIQQNQLLMKKFEVEGFPTLLLLDSGQNLIAKAGYLPLNGKQYADHIKEILEDYDSMQKSLDHPEDLDEFSWKKLHEKVQKLNSSYFENKIYSSGKKYCPSPYFYLLKYEQLLHEGKIFSSEGNYIKEKIVELDPQNIFGSRLKMAILDFEAISKVEKNPKKAIIPLTKYIEVFGKKDKVHLWKLYLMISRYLLGKEKWKEGLVYAKLSFRFAPKVVRKEIIILITDFQKEIDKKSNQGFLKSTP